jgi:hypothetical protein
MVVSTTARMWLSNCVVTSMTHCACQETEGAGFPQPSKLVCPECVHLDVAGFRCFINCILLFIIKSLLCVIVIM